VLAAGAGGCIFHLSVIRKSCYTDGLYTKGARAHTHRELIREWLWQPKGSSLKISRCLGGSRRRDPMAALRAIHTPHAIPIHRACWKAACASACASGPRRTRVCSVHKGYPSWLLCSLYINRLWRVVFTSPMWLLFDYWAVVAPLLVLSSCVCVCLRLCRVSVCVCGLVCLSCVCVWPDLFLFVQGVLEGRVCILSGGRELTLFTTGARACSTALGI